MIIGAKYFDNYKLLIDFMNNQERKVIAFLGAGLTRKFGYGSWKELIFGNKEITKPSKPNCLKDCAELIMEDFEEFRISTDEYDIPS